MQEKHTTSNKYWEVKPLWCQPWTIITSGLVFIYLSWITLHITFLTVTVSIFVFIWWVIFLYFVPRSYQISYKNEDTNTNE